MRNEIIKNVCWKLIFPPINIFFYHIFIFNIYFIIKNIIYNFYHHIKITFKIIFSNIISLLKIFNKSFQYYIKNIYIKNKKIPIGRYGTPEDISKVVLFVPSTISALFKIRVLIIIYKKIKISNFFKFLMEAGLIVGVEDLQWETCLLKQ